MTRRRIHILSLLFLLPWAFAFDSDFSFYPRNAQPCLYSASKASSCSGDSVKALNACLCGNGGNFITRTAQCLGKQDKADVQPVYSTMSEACANSGTPMTISQRDFIDAAVGNAETTASVTRTATTTETATTMSSSATASATQSAANKNDESTGLSKGAVIGIAVGAAAVGVLGTMALVIFCIRRRRQHTEVESHPMLGQSEDYQSTPTTFPPREPSPDLGQYAADQKSAWATSPLSGLNSPQKSPSAWFGVQHGIPHHQSALKESGVMTGHWSEMHGGPGQTYELDGLSVLAAAPSSARLAAEMEGSQPPRHSAMN